MTRKRSKPENPWKGLPRKPPYVLPEDDCAIRDFNSHARAEHRIHCEVFPEPYLGCPDAPVVLLNLNPGFKKADHAQHRRPAFAARSRANLVHMRAEYPFYLLDPGIKRTKYWDRKLHRLIERCGRRRVAQRVFCVEFFPYHSRRFKRLKRWLPSQEYSFLLVRRALERAAVILLLRGKKHWFQAAPELESYSLLFEASSPQNPAVTPRNFLRGYELAVDALGVG